MKAKFYTAFLLLLSINGYGQRALQEGQIDSVLEQKFVLVSKNDAASSGKYKHLQVFINYEKVDDTYYVSVYSDKDINCYLEVKDQDENVIFFKPVIIKEGGNAIQIQTEDGTQTFFKLYFEEIRKEDAAVYVFRFVKEITYSRK